MPDMPLQLPLLFPGPGYAAVDRLHEKAHEAIDQAGLFQNEPPVLRHEPLQEEADHGMSQPQRTWQGSMNRTGPQTESFFISQAIFSPRLLNVATPSSSCNTSPGFLPMPMLQ